MNWIVPFLVGLIIGWLIELAIDLLFWRKRHPLPHDDSRHLQATLQQLKQEHRHRQDENTRHLNLLQTELSQKNGRLDTLAAELSIARGHIIALSSNLNEQQETDHLKNKPVDALTKEQETQLAASQIEIETLHIALEAATTKINTLLTDLEVQEHTLANVYADLADCQAAQAGKNTSPQHDAINPSKRT